MITAEVELYLLPDTSWLFISILTFNLYEHTT